MLRGAGGAILPPAPSRLGRTYPLLACRATPRPRCCHTTAAASPPLTQLMRGTTASWAPGDRGPGVQWGHGPSKVEGDMATGSWQRDQEHVWGTKTHKQVLDLKKILLQKKSEYNHSVIITNSWESMRFVLCRTPQKWQGLLGKGHCGNGSALLV